MKGGVGGGKGHRSIFSANSLIEDSSLFFLEKQMYFFFLVNRLTGSRWFKIAALGLLLQKKSIQRLPGSIHALRDKVVCERQNRKKKILPSKSQHQSAVLPLSAGYH